ncbi:SDR family NAD(P)-dependent oxidoreductase [Sinimarinibacterium sp. CAU 1509]|uniref:SDR family NAD(P)-dependent oxidoreductase n=1 Tax=Sinimarinibacterium sp. CAU 1509 TaxID=2562283 RepID=UPI001B7F916C|nr:SDR family NAD(P)-dependent oxidoreductase [Sinimarinibacterium sp. CAU 1509]
MAGRSSDRVGVCTALVTGANRGIGLEVCRQLLANGLRVVLTAREAEAAYSAARRLSDAEGDVLGMVLDVSKPGQVQACADALHMNGIQIDVLINNAGVFPQGGTLDAKASDFVDALAINALGALWCARAWMPAMNARGEGRVINISSGYGSFARGLQGPAPYGVSKAALNAVTLQLAHDAVAGVRVVAIDPGWVRTRMGGDAAPDAVEDAAADIVWAATAAEVPSGVLLRGRQVVDW